MNNSIGAILNFKFPGKKDQGAWRTRKPTTAAEFIAHWDNAAMGRGQPSAGELSTWDTELDTANASVAARRQRIRDNQGQGNSVPEIRNRLDDLIAQLGLDI